MNTERILYLCLTCFEVSRSEADHHGRRMVCCDVGAPGDERRKPAMDHSGRLKSHAPRWYLQVAYPAPSNYSFYL